MTGNRLATVLLLVLGCSASGSVLKRHPGEAQDTGPGAPAVVPAPSPGPDAILLESLRRYVALLERNGIVPVNVEVYWPDESPAAGTVVEATDSAFQKQTKAADEGGVARFSLPTLAIKRWRVTDGTAWLTVGAPQFFPEPSGMGLRAVFILPARPLSALVPAPTPAAGAPAAGAPALRNLGPWATPGPARRKP